MVEPSSQDVVCVSFVGTRNKDALKCEVVSPYYNRDVEEIIRSSNAFSTAFTVKEEPVEQTAVTPSETSGPPYPAPVYDYSYYPKPGKIR